ncbi:MAG: hypothetical protein HKN85_02060, partial [Gammaproteobacteria bacterium]|nr:hypothetical protein [Gammaproteobacteria bacterium]
YHAGDKDADAHAGFQKSDERHDNQRVLLMFLQPRVEKLFDDYYGFLAVN